jgi:hypothetical protein
VNTISFMSANYVPREVGYAMHGWGHGDRATNEAFRPLDTYEQRLDDLLREPYPGIDWGRARVELRDAVADGREPRASARHAAHVVEALEAIDRSRRSGGAVDVASDFEQPAPMEWAR